MIQEEEKLVRELMGQSEVKMPYPDFEEKLMVRINREAQRSRSFVRDIKLSWFFFLTGTVLGIMITLLLTTINKPVYGIPPQRMLFIAESIFVILLLTQFDKLIALTKRKR